MKKLKAWLVDDETDAHALIEGLLKEYFPYIELVGISINIEDAWQYMRKGKPNLVFLDVNMPRGSGLDLLERFPVRKFETIIISAFPENESKLEKFRDVPFLQKPYSVDDFIELTNRAVEKIRKNPNAVHRID
ncbi:MAG: response regulator [Bacteroidales bacterium]|nr:response regulator [Bacteroidales bacterium]